MQKLFEAIREGDREGVEALVEADPSLAIFAAAIQGDAGAIETLLAANRRLVSAVSSDGWTPLPPGGALWQAGGGSPAAQ